MLFRKSCGRQIVSDSQSHSLLRDWVSVHDETGTKEESGFSPKTAKTGALRKVVPFGSL